jgi:hypothetical protein
MTTISRRVREGVEGGLRNLTVELGEPGLVEAPPAMSTGLDLAA